MAKTDWQMDDTVMPADLNQIGQEINELQTTTNTVQANLATHADDAVKHITADERTAWNAKASTDVVTTTANGLMSTSDKTKLDGIDTGAQVNRTIATAAQAVEGMDNTTDMTPLRTAQAIQMVTGNPALLTTVNKSNLVAAINEVKQDGSDWKSAVAGAITAAGVPTAATADRQIFVNNINDLILRPGINWITRAIATSAWMSVCYGNGLFVAVANSGTRVATSPNGINWTSRSAPANENWNSVCYGNGLFVAVASSGTGNRVMTSPDGINWTLRNSAADYYWKSVCYGNGLFVAVAPYASVVGESSLDNVMTSPDGINWTLRTGAATQSWTEVCYGNGLFVVTQDHSSSTGIMTSPDGINWTSRTALAGSGAGGFESLCYGNGLFVAVARYGTGNRVMTSPNGINWTSRTSAADNWWFSVCYGNGLFVAVAASGTGNRVMTSPDGINWTLRNSAADYYWISVCYGNGMFVAVAQSGSGNRVMTSGID